MRSLLLMMAIFLFMVHKPAEAQIVELDEYPIYKSSRSKDVSELTLSKRFKTQTVEFTKDYSVAEGLSILKIDLRGNVDSGTITITLFTADGEEFKTVSIDPASDVRYKQTLDLKRKPDNYIGDWKIKIKTDKADGKYSLSLSVR